MRVMVIIKATKSSEAGEMPNEQLLTDMGNYNEALVKAGGQAGRYPDVYVQVNIGAEAQKGGVAIAELPAFLDKVRASPLPLTGLMAMPPLDQQPGPYFALLADLARRHGVEGLSMGMSSDYPTAVMLGATAIRVGSALFD